MILSNLIRSRIEKHHRLRAILLVVALELVFAVYVWQHAAVRSIVLGFLVKNGHQYVLAWKDADTGYDSRSFSTLKDALSYVHELHLTLGHNPLAEQEMERVWLQDRAGAYVLLWKTLHYSILNRLTFDRESDALFFEKAFQKGSYSPSPYGHSVLFLPMRAE
jgi:hypothetical protein